MSHVADVYAGDLDSAVEAQGLPVDYVFRISADATPDVLSRVANQFNFANRAPTRVSLRTIADERVEIQVAMCDIAPSMAENIARKLGQLLMVTNVEQIRIRRRSPGLPEAAGPDEFVP